MDFVNKEYIKTKHMQHCPLDIAKQRPSAFGQLRKGLFDSWVDSSGSIPATEAHLTE